MTQIKDIVEQKKFRDKRSGQKVSWRQKGETSKKENTRDEWGGGAA